MNPLFLFFYEALLGLLALLYIPKVIYSYLFKKKYRDSLLPRFGVGFPDFNLNSLRSIWIHAPSVGETKALVSLARELKKRFPENPLIISSTTETGHAEAIRSLPFADYHAYLPLDFSGIVQKVIKKANPGLVLLCESDFWYNFLYYAKRAGAKLALVNGKVSERSVRRYSSFPNFSKRLFGLLDVLCLQNNLYRGRFLDMGVNEDKLVVTGNLKLDDDYPQLSVDEINDWRKKLGINPKDIVLTIGSSHMPEERLFLRILKQIWQRYPHLRVILVPRHPEKFKDVAKLLEDERVKWVNFSDINRCTGKEQVILIDAMGLLRMCYQLSDFALVGGSFVEHVGGHNIIEPCWYGKPVLFGPYMHTQIELVDYMSRYQAGRQVTEEGLQSILEDWLEHPQESQKIGARGVNLVKDLKGATKRTLDALEGLLADSNLSDKK